jgi:hypothetical protein
MSKFFLMFYFKWMHIILKNAPTKIPGPKKRLWSSKDVDGQLDGNYKQITALPVHWLFAL